MSQGQYLNLAGLVDDVRGLLRSPQVSRLIMDAINRFADIPIEWTRPTGERVQVTLRQLLEDPMIRDVLARKFSELRGGRAAEYLERIAAPPLQREELQALMAAPEAGSAIRQLPYRSGRPAFQDPTGLRRQYFLGEVMQNPQLVEVIRQGAQNAYIRGYSDGFSRGYSNAYNGRF